MLALPSGPARADLLCEGARIVAIGPDLDAPGARVIDAGGLTVGPGFIDIHVHGGGRHSFFTKDHQRIEAYAAWAPRNGVTSFLVSTVGTDPGDTAAILSALAPTIGSTAGAEALGFHLEGPFLSPEDGYRGAHPLENLARPDTRLFEKLQTASGDRIRLLTVAPELEGCLELIRSVSSRGICVALGHTNADFMTLARAWQAGASMFTHLGNGCALNIPRHDNIIQRVLALPGLMVSLIPDGIHLPPFVVSNLIKGLGPERTLFTTDAMSAAGAPPGEYSLGSLKVAVGGDRVVRLPGTGILAGSSLRMIDGFYNAARFGGIGAGQAWRSWSRLHNLFNPGAEIPLIAVPFPAGPG